MNILFLYVVDWSHEIANYKRGLVPSHRLFGYPEVAEFGHKSMVCPPRPFFRRLLSKPFLWRIYQAFYALFHQQSVDVVFAVNEASSLPVLLLKRLGLLRTPLIVFNTGLMHPRNLSGLRKAMWRWLLPAAEAVVSQTRMEKSSVWREFGLKEDRQFLIYMLVDLKFFQPDPGVKTADYCLSVGTTQGKDYGTLLAALPSAERLVIVTDAYNAAIIAEKIKPGMKVEVLQGIPIAKLKTMYQEAKVIINPLFDTAYGTGHTVVLENMVLGKSVIVTSVDGITDYFEDGVTAIGVREKNPDALRENIQAYLKHPEDFAEIARNARHWVRAFSCEEFTRKLLSIAEHVQLAPHLHGREANQKPQETTHEP